MSDTPREPRQWKHCEYCGHEMEIDGTCENCAIRDEEDMRQQWEYDYWRRIDAENLAEADNWFDDDDEDDWQD